MKIVPKAWGEEHWIVNERLYCGKKMVLRKGQQSSLHYHRLKDETFYVLNGRIRLELENETTILEPGAVVRIHPHMTHRFGGLEDSVFFEFSTGHSDEDVYRLEPSGPMKDTDGHQL